MRFKTARTQKQYNEVLKQARAGKYAIGPVLQTGTGMGGAFWLGYHGAPMVFGSGGPCHAAWAAGQDYRKENDRYVGLKTANGNTMKDWSAK